LLQHEGLRENTLLWYCGDNGSPRSTDRVTTPFRGEKALVYEGGIRVPGVIEWPAKIREGRSTDISAVTSDILPTVCELAGVEVPDRPLDGVSLNGLIEGTMTSRDKPICFWEYDTRRITRMDPRPKPYIDPALQEGTTPLVKYMGGKLTRSFNNYHHPPVTAEDYRGSRVILDGRYKLVIAGQRNDEDLVELFDLHADRAETNNLAGAKPELTEKLKRDLRDWQTSVLQSLSEADY
jgi:arylsulfatase A-like enzyme